MRTWLVIASWAALLLTSGPNPAYAIDPIKDCLGRKAREELRERGPVLDELENPNDLPLSLDFIESLRTHPISAWARKYRGKKLVVAGAAYLDKKSGEGIQGRFVFKILNQLFDSVEIKTQGELTLRELRAVVSEKALLDEIRVSQRLAYEWDKNPGFLERPRSEEIPEYPVMNLEIYDSAEQAPDKSKIKIHIADAKYDATGRVLGHLDMPFIKPANTTTASIDRVEVRELFGIRPEARVFNIYTADYRDTLLLEAIPASGGPDVVFYSENFDQSTRHLTNVVDPWAKKNGYALMALSRLRVGDLDTSDGKKFVVVNDTFGKMPYLHASADLSIIRGPINIFEGLNVGTPTVIFATKIERESKSVRYHQPTFEAMVRNAVATGGARRVRSSDEATTVYQEALGLGRDFTRPYQIEGPDGRTPVQRFLDHLKQAMEEQGL